MMENLPVEVISYILKYLTSIKDRKACSLISKAWYDAYQDPYFRNIEVLYITSDDRFQALVGLKNQNRRFLNCVIKETEISETSIKFWDRFGPHIKELSIFSCDIRQKMLINVLTRCEQLKSLSIQGCKELFMVGQLLENENKRLILREKLKSVTSLNLSFNRYLSDAIFVKFVSVLSSIQKLSLAGCQISFFSGLYIKFYPNGSLNLSESVLTFPIILDYIQNNAKQLNYLSFKDTYIDNAAICHLCKIKDLELNAIELRGCFQLSHEGILSLSKNQKSLTDLDVSFCSRITDESLLAICSSLNNLKSLSIQKCRSITDVGVTGLQQLEKLERLNMSECDLIEGEGIIKGICYKINLKLKELRVSHLGNMTSDTVVHLSKSLPNLKVLDLGFCYSGVTDKSVQSILENNKLLQTLILTKCEKLTDSGLTGMGLKLTPISKFEKENFKLPLGSKAEIEIVREAKLKQEVQEICENASDFSGFSLKMLKGLQHLNLSGCNGISDVSLIYALQLNELRNLDLSHCNQITEQGLKYLSENSKCIETLNLNLCQNITNEGVCYVIKNLKRLETLILGSKKITDNVAVMIANYGKELTYLDIRHCNQVSSSAINEIIKSLPSLPSFFFSTTKFEDVEIPIPPPLGNLLQ